MLALTRVAHWTCPARPRRVQQLAGTGALICLPCLHGRRCARRVLFTTQALRPLMAAKMNLVLVAACLLTGGGSRPAPCVTALPPLCALALRGGSSPPGAGALFAELPPRYNYSTAGDAPAPPTSRSWRALIEGPPAKKRHFVSVAQVWDPASPCASHALACTSITHPPYAFKHVRGGRTRCRVQGLGSLHPTPYTLHPTPCTLHPAPCTLHPTS